MDIKKKLDMFMNETFLHENLEDVVGDRFGRYSKYIIQERAIPDVRDGLKPVQRRILFAMDQMGVNSKSLYKKSARIAGEVMGKYHPHGDSSIYEAMVRMSQDWKMGVTLIDMHGNNGSIDGDGAAAMRYTEARMSKNADYLLKDIDKNTVPFIDNFDGEEHEPTVLPAKFPNLLVNGSVGISSGYATYIPTHNINEVVEATIYRIDHANMSIDDLLKIMPGPDFPTGGIVQGANAIRDAFTKGAGSIVVRSKVAFEDMSKDQKRIVVTEIPFDTNKAKLVERIDQLRIDKKVEDILEVRDETDRTGLRIAIDLKKNANENAILTYLFKNTDLQIRLNYNMVAIRDRKPCRLGVIEILDAYIEHSKVVITNRTNYDLAKSEKRLHIVEGLIKMVDIVSEVIACIRASKNKADSKQNLVAQFGFSEEQAEAIVTMQLYRLSNTDIMALMNEREVLSNNIVEYHKILSSEKELLKVIKDELKDVNKQLPTPRRTVIEEEVSDLKIDEMDLISDEQVVVCVSKEGYIKRTSLKSYNTSKQNGLKENDSVLFLSELSTLDTLLLFTNQGNYLFIPVYKIEEVKFKELGSYVSSIVQVNSNEKIVACFARRTFSPDVTVLICTKQGQIKQTLLSEFLVTRYSKAIKAMRIADTDNVVSVDMTDNPLEIIVATKNAECLRFRSTDVSLYGTSAGGTKALNLKPRDEVVSAVYANMLDDILLLTQRGNIKRMKVEELSLSKRGRASSPVIKYIKSNPHLLQDCKRLSPNQYKEDVNINLVYEAGNDNITAFNIKYQAGDAGKTIMGEGIGNPLKMVIDAPKNPDEHVSGDYLVDVNEKIDLFSLDDQITQKPLKAGKSVNILDELDAILNESQKETPNPVIKEDNDVIIKETKASVVVRRKTENDYFQSPADSQDEEEKSLEFKKISLFDEE